MRCTSCTVSQPQQHGDMKTSIPKILSSGYADPGFLGVEVRSP